MSKANQDSFDGMEDHKTALGFGGKTVPRELHIGDELYVLMHLEISSEGMKETEAGMSYSAGARTKILCYLDSGEATKIAAEHGWTPPEEEPEEPAE